MAEKSKRNTAFDVINILACLCVVTLHHNGLVHSFDGGTAGWVQSLIAECIFYCGVPLFMMLSGANLLAYKERYDTITFFKKRFLRTVIPWIAWSIIFLIWKIKTGEIVLEPPTVRQGLRLIFTYKVESVYWFFGELFACYLVMPILSALRNQRRILWYLVGLNFVIVSVYPILQKWLNLSFALKAPATGSLVIFVILGYLLSTEMPGRKERIILYVLGILGVLFRFFYTWYFSVQTGITDTSIKGYERFHSVFWACAVFILLMRIPWDRIASANAKKYLSELSECSFGVFLIHRMVMKYESLLLGIGNRNWTWRILCIPLTYIVSLAIVFCLRKIPVIKRLMG